jgi:hypothetical protein
MNVLPAPRVSLALLALFLAGFAAHGQEAAPNPGRGILEFLGLTTDVGPRPDFVARSRPDEDKLDYSPLTGPEKKRKPVKSPSELAADTAELIAARQKNADRVKKLQGERVAPVAPNKKPPVSDDQF